MSEGVPRECDHPDQCESWREAIEAMLHGEPSDAENQLAAEALSRCESCRRRVESLTPLPVPPAALSRTEGEESCRSTARMVAEVAGRVGWPQRDAQGRAKLPNGCTMPPSPRVGALGRLGGRYDLLAWLGGGAMGTVYRGWDCKLERAVAVKLLAVEHAGGHAAEGTAEREQLIAEARLQASARHPGVAAVYDADVDPATGSAYIVSAFVEGWPLSAILEERGRVAEPQALAWTAQILEILAAVHPEGIVHRDIKPSNILIDSKGKVRLIDFGVGRAARAGMRGRPGLSGTPAFMAPEQAMGDDGVDLRTDLYAVGVCLFEMVSGRVPFEAGGGMDVVELVRTTDPPRSRDLAPDVRDAVHRLIERAMQRDRAARFQSADEFLAAVNQVRPGTIVPPCALSAATPVAHARRPLSVKEGLAGQAVFLSDVRERIGAQTTWHDPLRQASFAATGHVATTIPADGAIRHGAASLGDLNRYSLVHRRGLRRRLEVRIDAVTSVRMERFLRDSGDAEPADVPLVRQSIAPALNQARRDDVWVVLFVHSPTGFVPEARRWAAEEGLGSAAGVVLWESPGVLTFRRDDARLSRHRDLVRDHQETERLESMGKWVLGELVHRPAVGVAELAIRFDLSAARALEVAEQLAARGTLRLQEFPVTGKILTPAD
jgi:hypothetical protein